MTTNAHSVREGIERLAIVTTQHALQLAPVIHSVVISGAGAPSESADGRLLRKSTGV